MGPPCRNHLYSSHPLLWTKDYTPSRDPTVKYSSSPEVSSYKSRGGGGDLSSQRREDKPTLCSKDTKLALLSSSLPALGPSVQEEAA